MAYWAIDVKDEDEGKLLDIALNDPVCRASMIMFATLKSLPSDRARQRVIAYIRDFIDDPDTLPQE